MVNFLKSENFFEFRDMTDALLNVPNVWGRLNESGLFVNKGISHTSVSFDIEDKTLVLLDSSNRGTRKGTVGSDSNRKMMAFPTAFYEHSDRVTAADVQGIRRTGSADQEKTIAEAVADKLADMKLRHYATHEYMKMGAIKGLVVSPNGTTYADLFTSFGLTQKSIDFVLGTSTTDIDAKITELIHYVEDNAQAGMVVGGIKVLVDTTFFDALIGHAKVREAWLAYKQDRNSGFLIDQLTTGRTDKQSTIREFTYKGVSFEEYRGSYTKSDGTVETLVDDTSSFGNGHAFPTSNMSNMFVNYQAPADHMDYVNTIGEEMYAWSFPDQKGRWLDLDSQSSLLPICKRPQVLVKVYSSN